MNNSLPSRSRLVEALVSTLFGGTRSIVEEIIEPVEPLEDLPGGPAIKELIDEVGEATAAQLELFCEAIGVRKFHARAYVFEKEEHDDKMVWAAHPARYADPRGFTTDPKDLLEELEAIQEHLTTGDESVLLWLYGMRSLGTPMFVCVARHSTGTLAQFLLRGRKWVRAPLGEKSLEILLHSSSSLHGDVADFWSGGLAALITGLVAARTEKLDAVLKSLGVSKRLTDEQLVDLVKHIVTSKRGIQTCLGFARTLAHSPLRESQQLLEELTGLADHAKRAIAEEGAKVRKEQAGTLRKLQSTMERERILAAGVKRRADELSRENQTLRCHQSTGAAPTAAPLWTVTQELLKGA